jgi:glycerol transport system ATP-binding protein
VIDPHLKWTLRSKLKELHQKVRVTMIYVTHDQTEALTFADQVVVMEDGQIVQIGTPVELFERPTHTFVGHFIGSPGMNILPCNVQNGLALFEGHTVVLEGPIEAGTVDQGAGLTQIGIRPEFITFGATGVPATVRKVADIGRHSVVDAVVGETLIKVIVEGAAPVQGAATHLRFDPSKTRLYRDGWIATQALEAAE